MSKKWVLDNIGLNVDLNLLQEVKKVILEEPMRFRMDHWGTQFDTDIIDVSLPQCGTVACLAGWTKIIACKASIKDRSKPSFFFDTDLIAQRELRVLSDSLFFVSKWPTEFADTYNTADTALAQAGVAAELIDFITTVVNKHRSIK